MAEAEVATIRLFIGTNTPPGSNPLTLTAQCVATMESEHITYYNVVGSCIVDAGIWVLYNGDNYSHGGIVLTPGTYPDLGLPGLLDSSTSLRSLRPLPPGGDVALVLFQDTTFCGRSIALSRDCVDLGSVDSHSDLCRNPATSFGASSAIVVSGKWTLWTDTYFRGDSQTIFHEDTSFSPNPSCPPGTYPKLNHNDGTKSAQVASAEPTDGWAWMAALGDELLLSQLTIPGTHDSGAIRGDRPIVDDISQCQYMTASEQLNAGIRFFDLRLNGSLGVNHGGMDELTNLADWCTSIGLFLAQQPRECVILSIDCTDTTDSSTFQKAVAEQFASFSRTNQPSFGFNCFTENRIPRLGEVRGQVVILRRFNYDGAYGWACSAKWTHGKDPFQISLDGTDLIIGQDDYDLHTMAAPSMETKWSLIQTLLAKAVSDPAPNHLYINFISGAGDKPSAGLPWPVTVALCDTPLLPRQGMNYRLLDQLTNNRPPRRVGIIAMDFPDKPSTLIRTIIACNGLSPE